MDGLARDALNLGSVSLKTMGLFGGGLAGMFAAGIFTVLTHQTGILIGFLVSTIVVYWAVQSGAVHFFSTAASAS